MLQMQASRKDDRGPIQTILVVENDAATLVARSLILRCFGYTVLEASDRGEAWSFCGEHSGTIRLIMMETSLDHDSAYEFFTRLQLVHPQIRALLFTDASSARMAEKFVMPCECYFLQRPFRADALADAIKGLLDGPKARAVSSAW
jgi:DNA-binding NtrC family response regulator